MKQQVKSVTVKKVFRSIKRTSDTTVIRNHMMSLDNEAIKTALITSGMYDSNMKLTASFR
jgi:hypothetical protein